MVSTLEHALRIVSVDDEIIPAMSEKLVDGFIERPEADIPGEDSMLVETNVAFRDRFGCLLTPVVVNTAGQVSTCVRVFNPFPQPVLIPGEVVMGELEPVEVLRVLKEKENLGEDQNFSRSRRVVFTPNDSQKGLDEINPLVSENVRMTHVSRKCVSGEFLVGARRVPRKSGIKVTTSRGAEAGQRTKIIAGPRTEIINRDASQGAEAGQRTETIAGLRTEIINEDTSQGAEAGQRTETINEDPSQMAEAGQRTEIINGNIGNEADEEIPPHMREFIDRSTKGWSKPQQQAIRKMLLQFQDVFSKDELDIGQTHLMEAEIDTGDAKPVRNRPRPMARSMEEEGWKVIEQMEKRGLIRPSKSPWASNVTLVRKPNGKIRITIDYRGLNAVTQVPVSNQPKTQDCIDALATAKYFSLGDSSAAYHQIRMKEEDIPKTAFITKFGLYEWVTLPMGLSGAPFCYTRLMELALAGLQWNTCVIYLDDVIVFGKTFEEHLSRLAEVLERFRSAGLKLKPEKCQFF